ncbi:unnamed protein product [Closterium sp. NIES-53]
MGCQSLVRPSPHRTPLPSPHTPPLTARHSSVFLPSPAVSLPARRHVLTSSALSWPPLWCCRGSHGWRCDPNHRPRASLPGMASGGPQWCPLPPHAAFPASSHSTRAELAPTRFFLGLTFGVAVIFTSSGSSYCFLSQGLDFTQFQHSLPFSSSHFQGTVYSASRLHGSSFQHAWRY